MSESVVVYDTAPESDERYATIEIDVLDGNGEYVNSMQLRLQGKITFVRLVENE